MKKIIFAISFMAAFDNYAQTYMGVQWSYGIGVQGRTLGEFGLIDFSHDNNGNTIIIDKRSSFGGGLKLGGLIGFKINKRVDFEFIANFHQTNKVSLSYSGTIDNEKRNFSMCGNFISLNPLLVGCIYDKGPTIYIKVGGVYTRGNFINKDVLENISMPHQSSLTYKINKGQALGLSFSVGANWEIRKNLKFRTELDYVTANYYPGKKSLIAYEMNGQKMPVTNAQNFDITYSKSSNNQGGINGTTLRPQIPMNGVGLNVGLIYSLKKINKRK